MNEQRCSGKEPECPAGVFSPISVGPAYVLILGSFPGRQSLLKQEYYGNEKNHFWQIIESLFQIDRHLPYSTRTVQLGSMGVALWDVISECNRTGSSDTRIRDPVFNDIAGFLELNPSLQLIALNGSTAGRYYVRLNITDVRSFRNPAVNQPGKHEVYP